MNNDIEKWDHQAEMNHMKTGRLNSYRNLPSRQFPENIFIKAISLAENEGIQ